MLFILSSNSDHSTAQVIKWLIKHKINFSRFNGESQVQSIELNLSHDLSPSIKIVNLDQKSYLLSVSVRPNIILRLFHTISLARALQSD